MMKRKHVSDSRRVEEGDVFYAIRGEKLNGENFIADAIAKGASEIVCQENAKIPQNLEYINLVRIQNPRLELTKNIANFYQNQPENICAVTGTNGKTSVAWFFRQLCSYAGKNSGFIGTLGISADGIIAPTDSTHTSPPPETLYHTLDSLACNDITHLCMEASSHGLSQYRLDGVKFKIAAFTGISQDHLDYHKSIENYINSKLRLFKEILPEGAIAILNVDDKYVNLFRSTAKERNLQILTFGMQDADAKIILEDDCYKIKVSDRIIDIPKNIYGNFQIYNLACAILMAIKSGVSIDDIIKNISLLTMPPGRMEKIIDNKERNIKIFIDFAHTPHALQGILQFFKNSHNYKKLYLVFGCGGERDKSKRIKMGEIAVKYADNVIITDDNPRNEDPAEIRAQIIAGCRNNTKVQEIADRKEAVLNAMKQLNDGDILLIAGKGHETHQIYNAARIFYSDREEIINNAYNLTLI